MLGELDLSDSDKLGLLTNAISWGFIFGGWYIVNAQNNKRETRKELRVAFDEIINDVRQLAELGISYHVEGHSDDLMYNIVSLSKRLNRKVSRLGVPFEERLKLGEPLLVQKKKVTMVNNFGSGSNVQRLSFYSNEIAYIENATESLLDEIEKTFDSRFSKVKD